MTTQRSQATPEPQGPLDLGTIAPNVLLPSQDEGRHHVQLSSLQGQIVVLSFQHQTWNPAEEELFASFVRMEAESRDSRQPLRSSESHTLKVTPSVAAQSNRLESIRRTGDWVHLKLTGEVFSFPLYSQLSPHGSVARAFGVSGRHAVILIGSGGRIEWQYVAPRGAILTAASLTTAFEALQRLHLGKVSGPAAASLSRRQFLAASCAFASLAASLSYPAKALAAKAHAQTEQQVLPDAQVPVAHGIHLNLTVNGAMHKLHLDVRTTLLDALRNHIGLTGSKKGCDHGQCGACTVVVAGRRINSCLTLAASCEDRSIETIEGLAGDQDLHPLQAAFLSHDGFQCGYCTSGQIMSAVGFIREQWGSEDQDVREGMSGNLCRCGAYQNIVAAIQDVRHQGGSHGGF